MIATAVIHLIFMVKAKTADESSWTTAVLAIMGGVGLIAAGDAGKSVTKDELQETKKEFDTKLFEKTDNPKP